jgi:hypothetical protein
VLIDLRRRYGPPTDEDPYGDATTALAGART